MKKGPCLQILKPGLQTIIVDRRRIGYQEFGVPFGGPMDWKSACTANWLVGNDAENPLLEVTLLGPEIHFLKDVIIALTGAEFMPVLNGNQPVPMNRTVAIKKGSNLAIGSVKLGCRAYLAIGGKWEVSDLLGSAGSLFTGSNSGMKKGDLVFVRDRGFVEEKIVAFGSFPDEVSVRVARGPEFDRFSKAMIDSFFTTSFHVSPLLNRMGMRLEQAIPAFKTYPQLISSGILPGTIQILPSGQPVILLADAQTTGGYYRIAQVIEEDLDTLAQLIPGNKITFIAPSLNG